MTKSVQNEMAEAQDEFEKRQAEERKKLQVEDARLSKFAVKGDENDWADIGTGIQPGQVVSIKQLSCAFLSFLRIYFCSKEEGVLKRKPLAIPNEPTKKGKKRKKNKA